MLISWLTRGVDPRGKVGPWKVVTIELPWQLRSDLPTPIMTSPRGITVRIGFFLVPCLGWFSCNSPCVMYILYYYLWIWSSPLFIASHDSFLFSCINLASCSSIPIALHHQWLIIFNSPTTVSVNISKQLKFLNLLNLDRKQKYKVANVRNSKKKMCATNVPSFLTNESHFFEIIVAICDFLLIHDYLKPDVELKIILN